MLAKAAREVAERVRLQCQGTITLPADAPAGAARELQVRLVMLILGKLLLDWGTKAVLRKGKANPAGLNALRGASSQVNQPHWRRPTSPSWHIPFRPSTATDAWPRSKSARLPRMN